MVRRGLLSLAFLRGDREVNVSRRGKGGGRHIQEEYIDEEEEEPEVY